MKQHTMMNANDMKQFVIDFPQLPAEEKKTTREYHESLMAHYKTMSGPTAVRMSQISVQMKLLSAEMDELTSVYKEMYERHAIHRKEWEKLNGDVQT